MVSVLLRDQILKEITKRRSVTVVRIMSAGVIESEEGEEGADEDQLFDVGQVRSAETYRDKNF